MADNIQESTVWSVNELGEIVFDAGVGTSNVVGFLPSGQIPSSVNGKLAAVVNGFNKTYNIVANLPQTIALPEGWTLALVGAASSAGTVTQVGGTGNWTFGVGARALIGPFTGTQKLLVTCSSGSVAASLAHGVVSIPSFTGPSIVGAASNFAASTRRYEALVKPSGCTANGLAFNQTASLSTATFCCTVKMEVETDFDAVKLFAVNRAVNSIASIKALVGVTETADMTTSAKLGSPTVGGTTYQALQGSADANGWRSYTWSGATSGALAAANTAQQVVGGDWAAKSSIPRADGGVRPFLMFRSFIDGSVSPIAYHSNYTTAMQTASAANRGRIIQASSGFSDGIATPGIGMSASALSIEVFPALRFRTPVFSVWSCGDSIVQNDGIVADKISSWVARACNDSSSVTHPVVHANFGASSQTAATTLTIVKAWLAAGAPPPSCIIAELGASVNDSAYDANTVELQSSRMAEWAKLCSDNKIPYLVAIGMFPKDTNTQSQDAFRTAMNAKISTFANSVGIIYLDFPGLGDGATPERWVPSYKFDALHPNELAIDTVMAPRAKTAIAMLNP